MQLVLGYFSFDFMVSVVLLFAYSVLCAPWCLYFAHYRLGSCIHGYCDLMVKFDSVWTNMG